MCDNHISEKEIVRVTSESASKRHLPPWMLPKVAAATIPVRNSDRAENNRTSEKEALAEAPDLTENAETALKKKAGTGHKAATLRRKSYSHAEREVNSRTKLSKQDTSIDDGAIQKDRKKIDSSKARVLKSSLKKSQVVEGPNRGNIDVSSVQGLNDDDIELTIEDLMAIAEEYVKEYENRVQKEASNSQCESGKQFPTTGEFGNSLDSHCERSSTPAEGLYSSPSNKTVELGTSLAGDPTQDMLNILLGPLLQQPFEEEESKSIVESVEFMHKSTGKRQEEFSGEDKVPLTKRKCSLKDKVGLFFH